MNDELDADQMDSRNNNLRRKINGLSNDTETDATTSTSPASSTASIPRPQSISSAVLAIDPGEIQIVTVDDTDYCNGSTQSDLSQQQSLPFGSSALPSYIPFVGMFRGSANYIANHRNTLAVYHIPGSILTENDNDTNNSEAFRNLMNDISLTWLLGMKVVLVVGCRHQIERRLLRDKQQHQSTTPTYHSTTGAPHDWAGSLHDGALRVTDEETLRVVKEEAGYVRFEVERQLARSLRIQGGSGGEKIHSEHGGNFDGNVVSGNFYSAQPFGVRDGVDYK
jgi:hypothetical protein